jgi:carboxyl-terminal processing protease
MNLFKSRKSKILLLVALMGIGLSATFTNSGNYFEIAKNIEIFANIYKELNTHYVDEIDPSKLMRTGLNAMLESLDPYTNYISESDVEGFKYITEGKYNGIGADIRIIDDFPTIVSPYENSPAMKAGMKAGDQILTIDGKVAKGRNTEEISAILKGYPGTEVIITVKRPGEPKELKLSLVRDEVSVPNVPYSGMLNEDVGYIALTIFTREAGRHVSRALQDLKVDQPELKGVILDLRGNGGGLLTEAVEVCNVFIPKGETVVTTKGKLKEMDRSFNTLNAPVDLTVPLIVLIDKGSASASEIVSGTIQDLDRGILLGQRSYGKGLVQNTRDIGYNSMLKLTTAKYYIPSGRCIQSIEYKQGEPADIPDSKRVPFKTRNGRTVLDGGGVKPDVVIELHGGKELLKILEEKNIVFNYATQYCLQHPNSPKTPEEFRFSSWPDFIAYLEKQNFDYNTNFERLLKEFKENSAKEKYLSDEDIKSLESRVIAAKRKELDSYKNEIINLLEKEIISRYFFEKGRIKVGLRNDVEIQEAIKLFGDKARFEKLLKG